MHTRQSSQCPTLRLAVAGLMLFALVPRSAVAVEPGESAQSSRAESSISGRVKNAASGQYLGKARISLRGTDHVTYTDDFGSYRFVGVAPGAVTLDVFYTDLDPVAVPLTLAAGTELTQDIELTSMARYGRDSVLKLDALTVESNREADAEALAINEQRFASNLINVFATDSMGDLVGNDMGEFLKYLPGLSAEMGEGDVTGISVRGIGADMTGINFDGAPVVTGANTGPSRYVDMRSLALNNISRVEVTKVPLPSTPADRLAGSVNMISKSAFERSRPELRYGLYLVGNSTALTLGKTPHAYGDKGTMKTQPGFDFDYTLPVSKDFGIVVTGMQSHKYTPQNQERMTWTSGGTNTGASFTNPFLQQWGLRAAPRSKTLTAGSLKADWRVARYGVLSVGARWSENIASRTGTLNTTVNTGTNANPTPASGTRMTFGPDYTIGATGRGGVTLASGQQYSIFENHGAYIKYRHDDGKWRIETSYNYSASETILNPNSNEPGGFFPNMEATLTMPVRITFTGIDQFNLANMQAFDNSNREIDLYDIRNYRITQAREDRRHLDNTTHFLNLDVRRRLQRFSFPAAVQVGALYSVHSMDRRNPIDTLWTPAAHNTDPSPYLYRNYVNQEGYERWRFPGVYAHRAWAAFYQDRSLFSQTPAQIANGEINRINTSQFAEQKVTAYYVQGEARLLDNRLNVVTGVRYEGTEVGGEGMLYDPNAVFARNPDGTFVRVNNQRVRLPEAGAAGSLQEVQLTRIERGYKTKRDYDGLYPSVHLTYNFMENFLGRLAYAKTYGRPDFPDVIPSATIRGADLGEADLNNPNVIKGDIVVTNTNLKPWTAHNFDLSLEYYTKQGGVFSAGAFLKEISDFFGTDVRVATTADLEEIGFDPAYVGWNLESKFNAGDARISGVEFNFRQSLRSLGNWGRYFTVFANATKLHLEGNPYGDFDQFLPKTANWGFVFNWKRLTVMPKWNYRGTQRFTSAPGYTPDAYQYISPITILDLSVSYRLSSRFTLTASVNNYFNEPRVRLRYGSETPEYARAFQRYDYGATFSVGIKGRF